jgi:hypothetical protein
MIVVRIVHYSTIIGVFLLPFAKGVCLMVRALWYHYDTIICTIMAHIIVVYGGPIIKICANIWI